VRVDAIGSSSLDWGDLGLGKAGLSSDDSMAASRSDGRLSPSNSWMSGLGIPRYGLFVRVSWSSSCHCPSCRVTARAF
jgi:hypothetical protein